MYIKENKKTFMKKTKLCDNMQRNLIVSLKTQKPKNIYNIFVL